jgi:PKD domain
MLRLAGAVVGLAAMATAVTNASAGLPVPAQPSKAPIVRLAGTGTPGAFSGGGNALQTTFMNADGVAWSLNPGSHDIYFTDNISNRVYFLSGTTMGLFAGSGSANTSNGDTNLAGIPSPTGVAPYSNGVDNMTISSMKQLASTGWLRNWVQISNGIGTLLQFSGLAEPRDLSVDRSTGDGYVADHLGQTIRTTAGGTVAGGGGADPPPADDPLGGSIDAPTDVAVLDASTGTFLFTSEKFQGGNVWKVSDAGTAQDAISVLSGDGTSTDNGTTAAEAKLLFPSSIEALPDGYLVYDSGHRLIRRVVDTEGVSLISNIAGNGTDGVAAPGTPADEAPLAFDGDLAVTPDGLVFTQGNAAVLQMIPATAITDGPDALTTSHTATFTLASWDTFAAYQCTLDNQPPVACASGQPFDNTPDGPHTMSVQATTRGGTMADASAAVRTWIVDSTKPSEFDLASPGDQEVTGSTAFSWKAATDDGPGEVRYELWVDGTKTDAAATCADGACSAGSGVPDGTHTWQVKAFDDAGNVRESVTRAFTMRQPPTAALTISPNPALPGRNVTFDASKSVDPNGQITGVVWDLDGNGSFETDTGANLVTTKSFPSPTTVQAQVQVTDSGGNTSVAGGKLVVTSTPPRNRPLGVSIDDGAQYTNDPKVTVFAVWPSFASNAFVSNDGGFKNGQTFPVAEQIPWTLDSSGPERLPKTIYVRFESGSQTSETYQDDIILDQTPPKVLSASLTSGGSKAARTAAKKKVTLKLKATDNVSGVSGVQVTASKRKPGKVLRYKKSLKVKPAKKLYVRVRDKAGNFSAWRTVKKR